MPELDLVATDSVVGAQITSGTPIEDLYRRQLDPPSSELPARVA